MYGVGDVGGFVVVVGGSELGISEVVEGNVEMLGVGDVDEVPEEGGASRLVGAGQDKPAMDASRLFSIRMCKWINMITEMIAGMCKWLR